MSQRYFLDTSALVVRYLGGAIGHAWIRTICDHSSGNLIGLVETTGAELAASLNQMVRGGLIRKRRCDRAVAAFWNQVDGGEYQIVPVTSMVVRRASDLCSIHSLKGYDSIQLTAALIYRDDARAFDATTAAAGQPALGDPIFLTEDHRLTAAARAEGFVVDNPLAHPRPCRVTYIRPSPGRLYVHRDLCGFASLPLRAPRSLRLNISCQDPVSYNAMVRTRTGCRSSQPPW